MDSTNAQTRYEQLRSDRDYYLDRARACSRLTLPYLIPPIQSQRQAVRRLIRCRGMALVPGVWAT